MASRGTPSKLSRFYSRSEVIAAALAITTIIAIPAKSFFTETRKLVPIKELSVLHGDGDHRGGRSYGEFVDDEQQSFICHLQESSYPYPFCGYTMQLSESLDDGMDLSKFDTIILDVDYVGESDAIRLYLRNFNSAYSTIDDHRTTKYHIIEFEKELLDSRFQVKLNDFKVADWWIAKNKVPFALSQTELSNVAVLQLQTGSKAPMGEHSFKINGIYVHRQIIPNEEFYFGMIIIWVAMAIAFLGFRLYLQNSVIVNQHFETRVLQKEKEVLDRIAENLNRKSKTDVLTGLVNRSGLEELIEHTFEDFASRGETFSYVLFDIDYFKKINDQYGHVAGDEILMELANYVRKNIRDKDVLGRWGGEEFIIICPQTHSRNAMRLAETLCNAVSDRAFSDGIKLTCSFGVASVLESDDAESLFFASDEALYAAKNSGRNRVVLASRHHESASEQAS